MNMNDLSIILSDYSMDWPCFECLPVRSKAFQKLSYKRWALDALWEELTNKAFPRDDCPLDELIFVTREFSKKMTKYSYTNKKTKDIFVCAQDVATDVLDILRSMKGE